MLVAFTDGSATIRYPKFGGCSFIIFDKGKAYSSRKGYCFTKTGRMELTAVIRCLRAIKNKNRRVRIYSDSMYVVNTCNIWIDNWDSYGYEGKKNVDLLKQLIFELRKFFKRPELVHIKGHQEGDSFEILSNNYADKLADYKTQLSYEVDEMPEDLNNVEKEDLIEINGIMYFNKDSGL